MALFEWENGTKTQNAIVTGDGVTVQDAVWEGETPISASNLNSAQTQLVETIEEDINTNLGTETDSWSSSSSYSINDRVIYAGGIYRNTTGNNTSAPNVDTDNWSLVSLIESNYVNENLIPPRLTKLWENPNPSQRFSNQNITLSSNDYDYLKWFYRVWATTDAVTSIDILKGSNAMLIGGGTAHMSGSSTYYGAVYQRICEYTNDTTYNVKDGTVYLGNQSSPGADGNVYLVPIAVYGGKF